MPPRHISVTETRTVPVADLKAYPRNPRRGDVDAIRKSIEAHGQFRALVVNRRTMQVLAGNHTLRALQELGLDKTLVHFVDVDEPTAAKINLIDNRAGDLGVYDQGELADLLQSLPELADTGYDDRDLERLVAKLDPPAAPAAGPTRKPNAVECPSCGHLFDPDGAGDG
jgi:ParB-like chromosome segregation protein Spo0J